MNSQVYVEVSNTQQLMRIILAWILQYLLLTLLMELSRLILILLILGRSPLIQSKLQVGKVFTHLKLIHLPLPLMWLMIVQLIISILQLFQFRIIMLIQLL